MLTPSAAEQFHITLWHTKDSIKELSHLPTQHIISALPQRWQLYRQAQKKMYTHFNIQNICLNHLLVIQIWYTEKGMSATHVEIENVSKVPTISLVDTSEFGRPVHEQPLG
jgi:hypothetical protein